ncbi:MAG: ATP-binding protein [Methylotenera sp.]|uniref:sensor histidine kinase n=1 Tax=Methylotenera sp. TaxID=2051956 RepID=UPI00272EE87D|nr:ATP-binding protein [Methylotenera sp.]MDP1523782.1 ATP-binding protein [Methylotenera sp.]
MWQPVMRQTKALSWQAIFLIVVGAGVGMFFLNWWVIAFWIAGLFALIGGRIFSGESTRDRLPNILASTYLLAILLLWVVPKLLKANDDLAAAEFLLTYFLPFLPIAILFLSSKSKISSQSTNIDFFYTLLIFLLSSIVILGSFAIGVIWKIHYIQLLIVVVMGLAATLVVLSWLWNPSSTFSGLELLMSRYLLSIGLPFEHWIRQIAKYAEYEPTAEKFLQAAMRELVALNWVNGLMWEVEGTKNQIGNSTPYISTFNFHQLHLTLYSRWQFSPAMYLHVQLLTQILGEFYEAKRREEMLIQNTYMQSLYETGSRLTHDIKNILQSMGTLSAAAEQSSDDGSDDARLIELVKKQLPRLNQRLASTLTKLERPSAEKKSQEKVASWWKTFNQINTQLQVSFEAPINMPKTNIDPDVLDSVVDNLLHNALEKAKLEANTLIKVSLMPSSHFCLEVTDTGSAIPDSVVERLFKSHISSKNGLGVGLFHAAQQANNAGYQLTLVDNRDGEVRFRLEMIVTEQVD